MFLLRHVPRTRGENMCDDLLAEKSEMFFLDLKMA
jgi:hypothetical protein